MLKLTSIITGRPVYIAPSAIMSLEQNEVRNEKDVPYGMATVVICSSGVSYYIAQSPAQIIEAINEFRTMCEDATIKLSKRIRDDGTDNWKGGYEDP